MTTNKYYRTCNLVAAIYMLSNIKRAGFMCRLGLVLPKAAYKTNKLKKLKKKLVVKLVTLQLEKIAFKVIKFKTRINLKNVFTLFRVKKQLKVPKNAII
jgi:hypothetical protein